MKLEERLTVGGTEYRIIRRDVALELSATGRASFRVEAKSKPKGLVLLQCGYARHTFHDFFMGYVHEATQESDKTWTLVCRELVDGLTQVAHVALRTCLITDVLADIERATRVKFSAVDAGKEVPRFASHADGYHAVRNLSRVFNIPDFVFWQQIDGKIWLGNWGKSAYFNPDRKIDRAFFTRYTPDSAVLPALPNLRPGMRVNGRRVQAIRLTQEHETLIRWNK